jgi:hypothetical protein
MLAARVPRPRAATQGGTTLLPLAEIERALDPLNLGEAYV